MYRPIIKQRAQVIGRKYNPEKLGEKSKPKIKPNTQSTSAKNSKKSLVFARIINMPAKNMRMLSISPAFAESPSGKPNKLMGVVLLSLSQEKKPRIEA